MSRYFYVLLLTCLLCQTELFPQGEKFSVMRCSFSSRLHDEFSPVFYKEGIVFCSNINDKALISYNDGQERLFKIFYAGLKDKTGWKLPLILSKELTSGFNDGPATFNKEGNIIFFSRNNSVEYKKKNISDTANMLGIYCSKYSQGIWDSITSFPYNDPSYTVTTPALTPDGKRLYFSSDMPGGYGGMDLYYCDSSAFGWKKPVNLGSLINTVYNESFPFADDNGKLFFASDGHNSFGGKDIFYSFEINGNWLEPVHLDAPINSDGDDFGLVTDTTFTSGFFSTSRQGTDDIFSFSAIPEEFEACGLQIENRYCYTLYDEHNISDSIPVSYVWDFGDGIIKRGKEVKHCFPGPGEHSVRLNIYDNVTGDTLASNVSFDVVLEEIDQGYIESGNIGLVDIPVSFNTILTGLKNFRANDFYWNFGDGFNPGGPVMDHKFTRKGENTVQLGLLGEKDTLGNVKKLCVVKKIRLFTSFQEYEYKRSDQDMLSGNQDDTLLIKPVELRVYSYFMDGLSERQKTRIKARLAEILNPVIKFDIGGLATSSYQVLKVVADILKANSDFRVETIVHSAGGDHGISEQYARELGFWFMNSEVNRELYGCKGAGSTPSLFKPELAGNKQPAMGFIEFVFMENR